VRPCAKSISSTHWTCRLRTKITFHSSVFIAHRCTIVIKDYLHVIHGCCIDFHTWSIVIHKWAIIMYMLAGVFPKTFPLNPMLVTKPLTDPAAIHRCIIMHCCLETWSCYIQMWFYFLHQVESGSKDCAVPMLWALEKKKEVDVFILYTNDKSWPMKIHPVTALRKYRTGMNKEHARCVAARVCVCVYNSSACIYYILEKGLIYITFLNIRINPMCTSFLLAHLLHSPADFTNSLISMNKRYLGHITGYFNYWTFIIKMFQSTV